MSMDYVCPNCGYLNTEVEEHLPNFACDDIEHQCGNEDCFAINSIGWVSEVEVRRTRIEGL